MAFALTRFQAYGIEAEEAVNKRYKQVAVFTMTGLNSDVDLDIGDAVSGSLGTFWTAVGATAPGITALGAIRDIGLRALSFVGVGGSTLAPYVQGDSSVALVTAITSAASAGGNPTETLTVTGLLTTDTILSAYIAEDGANPAYIQEAAAACAVAGQYVVTFSTDPGAGAQVRVALSRANTAVESGTYQISMNGTYVNLPNILFLSGNAPTTYNLMLEWVLKPQETPVEVDATA